MGVKALFVFNNTMALMDEFSTTKNADGRYVPSENDTAEYKARTLPILNVLAGELYPYSSNYRPTDDGTRPICPVIDDFDTPIDLDHYICVSVMPYGLAAHLLLQEDPSSAGFFQQRYEELRNKLTVGLPAESADIVDVYGGGYYDENGVWHYYGGDPIGMGQFSRW